MPIRVLCNQECDGRGAHHPDDWNHVPTFAANDANQIARNTAICSGAHSDGATWSLVAMAILHKLSR